MPVNCCMAGSVPQTLLGEGGGLDLLAADLTSQPLFPSKPTADRENSNDHHSLI